jgi:cardiolipin synthase
VPGEEMRVRIDRLFLLSLMLVACDVEVIEQQTGVPTPIKTQSQDGEAPPSEDGDGTPETFVPPDDTEAPPPSPSTIADSTITSTVLPENSRKAIILNALREAKTQVHAGFYLITDSSIRTAFIDAYKRGVDVKIIIDDSFQTTNQNKAHITAFKAAGVPVKVASGFRFHHAKYLLIDDYAMIMTCNFTDSSFSSNREVVTRVKDDGVLADLEDVFASDFEGQTTTVSADSPLVVSPDNARVKLEGLVANAKTEVFVSVQSVDDNPFVYRLIGLHRAGIKVRVLMADPADKEGDAGDADWLKNQGIEVRYLPTPYLHTKIIVADDKVYVGSNNLTQTSINLNREVGFVGDAAFTTKMLVQMEKDWTAGVAF